MVKEIQLTHGMVALVDDEDYEIVNVHKWHVRSHGHTHYAVTTVFSNGVAKKILMHRMILGAKPGQIIDHRDRNGLNNCRSNIRFATQSQNMCNQKPKDGKVSRYKGLTWTTYRWVVQIRVNGKNTRVGSFRSEVEAALAYNKAAKEHYGQFARLNSVVPEEDRVAPRKHNRDKTHCKNGHPYSGENLYIGSKNSRHCRECMRQYARETRARNRLVGVVNA